MSKLVKRLPISVGETVASSNEARSGEFDPACRDMFVWLVTPDHGASHWCDLLHLAEGNPNILITPRPTLLRALVADARLLSAGKSSGRVGQQVMALRHFWRFLDRQESAGLKLAHISDIDDADGVMFRAYLLNDIGSPSSAYATVGYIRALLDLARRRFDPGARELLWPMRKAREPMTHKDVDPLILKPLYNVLKRQYYSFVAAQRRGEELLALGIDPRLVDGGESKMAWSVEANVAVVTADFVERASCEAGFRGTSVHKRFGNPVNFGLPTFGSPPPGAKLRPFHRLRWFAPHPADAAACFLLVQMHFGWNVSTVRSIDVTEPGAWFDNRLKFESDAFETDATVAIYGYKNRTGKEQIGFSRTKPSHHPYQVLQTMLSATQRLRAGLHKRLAELETSPVRTPEIDREISNLRLDARSPWLCIPRVQGSSASTRVAPMPTSILIKEFSRFCRLAYRDALMSLIRNPSVRLEDGRLDRKVLRELRRPYLMLRTLTPSDLRDGFASYVYEKSLSDVFVLQRAPGHRSIRTSRHYLRQRRQLSERFGTFTRFQENLWNEIEVLKSVDPTVLFVRTTAGGITEEQRRRLAQGRELARMGMGCLNPTQPPPEIAPDHSGGFCAVQRCVLCRHGILFEESLPGLAIRKAELRQIRRQVSAGRWTGSSFEFEWAAIEMVIDRFFGNRREEFEVASREHLLLLESGEAYLFDQTPPRFVGDSMA